MPFNENDKRVNNNCKYNEPNTRGKLKYWKVSLFWPTLYIH